MKVISILWTTLGFAYCTSMFSSPATRLQPSGSGFGHSDFGFSIGFQNSTPPRLVVGAPRQDYMGKVYTCPLSDLSKEIYCSEVNMSTLINTIESQYLIPRQYINPNQYFYFGSSIAATADKFLTCAPMMTKRIGGSYDAYGSCYLYDNNNFHQFRDNGIKYDINGKFGKALISAGGLGWNSLADEENGRFLVAKTAMLGDIGYVDIKTPLETSKSLVEDLYQSLKLKFDDFWNFGYGLAVGRFFDTNTPLYAVSYHGANLKGNILFLKETREGKLDIVLNEVNPIQRELYTISNEELGSMFGYALAAADFNKDGLSELIVGAPAQTDDTKKKEPGTLYIYVGGDVLSRNDKKRMRTIQGISHRSRFGSAIATGDIDGDDIPELFVSAPYQYSEAGVVYVISGYELRKALLAEEGFKRILLSELVLTQELRSVGSKHLGFSLQVVQDLDQNGCKELAAGSPAADSVLLFRCLPSVTTSISLELLGDKIVKVDAPSFVVSVCVDVIVTTKSSRKVLGSIKATNTVDKPATEVNITEFVFDLSKKQCLNVTVKLLKEGKNEYTFSTELKLDRGGEGKRDVERWAVLSPYSDLYKTIKISRFCNNAAECLPKFKLDMQWLSNNTEYDFKSKTEESVKISVKNEGHDADGDVDLVVQGAPISILTNQCVKNGNEGYPLSNKYLCSLPKPLQRGKSHVITFSLNKTEPTNAGSLKVTAQINSRMGGPYKPVHLEKSFKLDPKPVQINGFNNNFNVTDKDLKNPHLSKYTNNHEYNIINSGPVTWVNLSAELLITKETFMQKVKLLTTETCAGNNSDDKKEYFVFHCTLTLKPNSNTSIVINIEISKEKIGQSLTSGKVNTNSRLSIQLLPTTDIRNESLTTEILYQKILTVGNNFTMIMSIVVAVAVVLISLLTFVLYKCGFFKRAEKKRLESLRESVRKRSVRLASERSRKSTVEGEHVDIEVWDDNTCEVFAPSPNSSKDDTVLIKEKTVEKNS